MTGKAQLAITPRQILAGPDVALVSDNWHTTGTNPDASPISMSGGSSEILRRQPDGTWLYVVDDPFTQV
jgi:ketosteroid isomerase-like protein